MSYLEPNATLTTIALDRLIEDDKREEWALAYSTLPEFVLKMATIASTARDLAFTDEFSEWTEDLRNAFDALEELLGKP